MNPRGGCLTKLDGCRLSDLLAGAYQRAFQGEKPAHPMIMPQDCAALNFGGEILLATLDVGPLLELDRIVAGRIAALNAMSDVYASGGVPRWALPVLVLDGDDGEQNAEDALVGVLQACSEELVQVVGGHTMVGRELLVGLTVLGAPRARSILRKSEGRPGGQLLLSKPLGVGLVLRAHSLHMLDERSLDDAVRVMQTSNGPASRLAVEVQVDAATDVTGFGLLGHLSEMLRENCGAQLSLSRVPVLESVQSIGEELLRSESLRANLAYARERRPLLGVTDVPSLAALLDPQTNGGLLVVAGNEAVALLERGGYSWIGCLTDSGCIEIQQ